MVEARVREDFEAGADCAAFWVVGAVDEAGDTGLDDGASAHAAGLDGDVERGVGEAVVAEQTGGFANDYHFRVCRWGTIPDRAVARTGEEFSLTAQAGAHRDLSR